jgi:hypothetical protein
VRVSDIQPGLRVNGARRRNGTCTGEVSQHRQQPEVAWRAEVVWDGGDTTWALISVLTAIEGVTT